MIESIRFVHVNNTPERLPEPSLLNTRSDISLADLERSIDEAIVRKLNPNHQ